MIAFEGFMLDLGVEGEDVGVVGVGGGGGKRGEGGGE